jgi:hypothetical protein
MVEGLQEPHRPIKTVNWACKDLSASALATDKKLAGY